MTIVVLILVILFLGFYTLVVLKQKDWIGAGALACLYSLLIAYALYSSGNCRPTWLSFIGKPMTVGSVMFQEDVAIYVFGIEEGETIPSCVILPWDIQTAQRANQLQIDGAPWEMDENSQEVFHPKPVPPLPPKQVQ